MAELHVQPTATAQWHDLVDEAAQRCGLRLDDELESYLVFLLMRFTSRPDMAATVMALEFLQSMYERGSRQEQQLRNVGDQCLLYSGLFPLRARRRRVRIRYYVDMGRSAYQQLSSSVERGWAELFARLAERFVPLMDVLQAMRIEHDPVSGDLLALHELRDDCGSPAAGRRLRERFGGSLHSAPGRRRH